VLVTAAGSALAPGRATAQTDFAVVNATVNAGAAYVVYFTGQLPNFSPGLIGSTFPLTHAHLDNSPFAEATASPADTGPAGGLVVSNYNGGPPPSPAPQTIQQQQTVDSRYPPGDTKPLTFGGAPGPYASAQSGSGGAVAQSGGVDIATPQPAASSASSQRSAFDAAMAQWRSRFMSPAAQAAQPAAASAAPPPDGIDGDTGSSTVSVDAAKGIVVNGDSRVAQASFGGGALVLHKVHCAVTMSNDGTPHADIVTTVGDASVGGVPVSIGKDGVVVASQVVALDAVQTASAALNGVLANAGITVTALAPQVHSSGSQETISATAVSVRVNNAGPPQQTVIYNLGNVFADNLAIPAAAAPPSLDTGPPSDLSGATTLTPPTSTDTGSTTTTPLSPPVGVNPPLTRVLPIHTKKPVNAAPAAVALAPKPAWLLAAYLLWQALIIATLASLWWWRRSSRTLPTPGSRP
jgi:hypothetical protein